LGLAPSRANPNRQSTQLYNTASGAAESTASLPNLVQPSPELRASFDSVFRLETSLRARKPKSDINFAF
jgi:hypothetical protein